MKGKIIDFHKPWRIAYLGRFNVRIQKPMRYNSTTARVPNIKRFIVHAIG